MEWQIHKCLSLPSLSRGDLGEYWSLTLSFKRSKPLCWVRPLVISARDRNSPQNSRVAQLYSSTRVHKGPWRCQVELVLWTFLKCLGQVRKYNPKYRAILGRMEKGCGKQHAPAKSTRCKGKLNSLDLFVVMKGEGNFNLHLIYIWSL